jgi:hypothetical protein
MAALFSCPRCTQALPASAAFCRRCGTAVEFSRQQPAVPTAKSSSLLTPVLVTLLILLVIGVGIVPFGILHTTSPTVVSPVYTNPTSYNPPAQPTYPVQVDSRYPTYPHQVVVTPVYPEHYDHRDSDDRGHFREQGR